jgi:hypothetical protein
LQQHGCLRSSQCFLLMEHLSSCRDQVANRFNMQYALASYVLSSRVAPHRDVSCRALSSCSVLCRAVSVMHCLCGVRFLVSSHSCSFSYFWSCLRDA